MGAPLLPTTDHSPRVASGVDSLCDGMVAVCIEKNVALLLSHWTSLFQPIVLQLQDLFEFGAKKTEGE